MQLVKKSLQTFFDSLRILRAVSEHEPRDLHGGDLQDRAAGHHIEPELPHFLRSGDRRGDRGDDDQQRTGTADDGRNADERKHARRAAAVDGVLDGLVQPVPRRRKAADDQTEHQQEQRSPAPAGDIAAVPDGKADVAQQSKDHQCRCRRDGVSKIQLHGKFPLALIALLTFRRRRPPAGRPWIPTALPRITRSAAVLVG